MARKRFGQNFLNDQGIIHRIVSCINASPDDQVIEIGPGRGALTQPLLEQGCQLTAIELDRDLIEPLKKQLKKHFTNDDFKIHSADALQFDYHSLYSGRPLKIVGNLPYNISTPLLFHLFHFCADVHDFHFMLQKEVAKRLGAEPGCSAYGRLSVMAQVHCQIDTLFEVPPSAFTPAPKVDSAIVRLTPHQRPPVDIESIENFQRVVTQSFSQRRKTLRNSLKTLISGEEMHALGIDPVRRAETLSLQEFTKLANTLGTD